VPENFPTTPRASTTVRVGAIIIGLAAILLATRTTITSSQWVGRMFPGFVILDNRVVASIGLSHWPGTSIPGLYQSEVVAVDLKPVATAPEVYDRIAGLSPGTPVRYHLRRAGVERDVIIPAQRFSLEDWFLLFGGYLLNGAVFIASGLVVWVLRSDAPLSRALMAWGTICGLFLLTAMDLYGPATFFRLHVVGESLIPAAGFHIALLFPNPHRYARFFLVPYAVACFVLLFYQAWLYHPTAYSTFLSVNMASLGVAALFFCARSVSAYWRGGSLLARQRVRVMTIGTLFGFCIPAVILLASVFMGGGVAMNVAADTPFLFALSLAYAVVKHDLFEIDAMVKRGAYYLVLTCAVGGAYVAAVVVLNLVLKAGAITNLPAFPVLFTFGVLLLVNPLRSRLQNFVDRVFFRTSYNAAQVLAGVGRELASSLTREQIAALVQGTVEAAVPNSRTRLFVAARPGDALRDVGGTESVPTRLVALLAQGRLVTAFDPTESFPDPATHDAIRTEMASLQAEIAVPLALRDELVGVLTTGAKRTGLFYTAGDAEFLRALAQQAAIALENARSYEALVELNARLEARVTERTAQLEGANRELADATAELKEAGVQLVQSEKMASLGRLVAGVAHEINNPVSFIAANVTPLRRRLGQAAGAVPPRTQALLREAEDIVGIMARGAERTAAIVKDLRTFSRLGEAQRKAADLHDGLEMGLRLLAPRWRGRIDIHRDYGKLPLVECDPAQINQVLMNLLTNACDAIPGRGQIWISTRSIGDSIEVTIRDDGAGIPSDVLPHVFDPFFTTKDVGRGAGLGLAVSHSVVAAHGGEITVENAPEGGATVRVTLPVGASVLSIGATAAAR
jgi:signal transduction histidine kinase